MPQRYRCVILVALLLSLLPASAWATLRDSTSPAPSTQLTPQRLPGGVQSFLERHNSALAAARFGEQSAAEIIEGYTTYYGLNPRVVLTLLELRAGLITGSQADEALLRRPFGAAGPDGFERQIEWAVRELRAGVGPYQSPPTVVFSDGRQRTLSLTDSPEAVSVQRFLAQGHSEAAWQELVGRYPTVYQRLFGDEPPPPLATPTTTTPFLSDPWPVGTRVIHSSWFDHAYPMVDVGGDQNSTMIDYLGRGGLSYNSHDGHDFYFPDQPYGTPMLAAAPGWAYARTTRGNGVVILHTGEAAGYETVYWHLLDFAPRFKDSIDSDTPIWIERGELLGWSGASGFTDGAPHLHFEVRHNGKQVDPFGWHGPGADPCLQYFACGVSTWLWSSSSVWQRPGLADTVDRTAPQGLLTINPDPNLALGLHFDEAVLADVGSGLPYAQRLSFEPGRFGRAVRVSPEAQLSYPISDHLSLDQGTLAFWVRLPEQLPDTGTGRNYLVAASDHPSDPARIYSDTFALRYEAAQTGRPAMWNFWTVSSYGISHSLTTTAQLDAGWHHMAISWSHSRGIKQLYVDGRLTAVGVGVMLPTHLEGRLELGRWYLESGVSDARFDELRLWRRSLSSTEIIALARAADAPQLSRQVLHERDLTLVTAALDNGGGIAQVQLGINGQFQPPLPYYGAYRWQLPAEEGRYDVAVRYVDRFGNASTITRTVELDLPPIGVARITTVGELLATVELSATDNHGPLEVRLSQRRDGSDGTWEPLTATRTWRWRPDLPRQLYVRFRNARGTQSEPLLLLADGSRTYLPLLGQ